MKASAEDIDFLEGKNYFSENYLLDIYYHNFYLKEADSSSYTQYNNSIIEPNHFYKLYNAKNRLVAEQNINISKNLFPYKDDTTAHTTTYEYNKNGDLIKKVTMNQTNSPLGQKTTTTETEDYQYLNPGQIHKVTYYGNDNLYRQEIYFYNEAGEKIKYLNQWFKPTLTSYSYLYNSKGDLINYSFKRNKKDIRNITLEYTYNKKGNWIKCRHFDKEKRNIYLIERIIEYH